MAVAADLDRLIQAPHGQADANRARPAGTAGPRSRRGFGRLLGPIAVGRRRPRQPIIREAELA